MSKIGEKIVSISCYALMDGLPAHRGRNHRICRKYISRFDCHFMAHSNLTFHHRLSISSLRKTVKKPVWPRRFTSV